jgi:oligopeptidase A
MSIDGFSAFQEVGMDNADAIAKEGLKYRDTILSLGGARAPALVFQVEIAFKLARADMF